MKKVLSIVLALMLVLVLGSCGGKTEEETTAAESGETSADTQAAYINPLNGSATDAEYEGRVVGVSINNVSPAMPFKGINSADVFFEMYINDYCTRGLALFSDIKKVDHVGSIRSTRYNFTDIAQGYNAVMCFSGGSGAVISDMQQSGIDYLFVDVPVGYRDQGRSAAGYAYEHTLFANGGSLYNAIEAGNMALTAPGEEYGFRFTAEGTPLNGVAANDIELIFTLFGREKASGFRYDAGLDKYVFRQYGKEMADDAAQQLVSFKNVIIMFAPTENQDVYHVADLIGTGDGYFACGGKMISVKWSRADDNDVFHFTLEDGSQLYQEAGNTYIAIAPTGSPVNVK